MKDYKPNSFDPSSENWMLIYGRGGMGETHLMDAVDFWFDPEHYSNISDRYTKAQVIDACMKFGYFSYDGWCIYYTTDKNQSSLDLMGGL